MFSVTQVDFLGHHLGQGMVGPYNVNAQKVKEAPRPTTKTEKRSFLGLVDCYQDFIAAPPSNLTYKGQPNKVAWGASQEQSYNTSKHAVVSKPFSTLPNIDSNIDSS